MHHGWGEGSHSENRTPEGETPPGFRQVQEQPPASPPTSLWARISPNRQAHNFPHIPASSQHWRSRQPISSGCHGNGEERSIIPIFDCPPPKKKTTRAEHRPPREADHRVIEILPPTEMMRGGQPRGATGGQALGEEEISSCKEEGKNNNNKHPTNQTAAPSTFPSLSLSLSLLPTPLFELTLCPHTCPTSFFKGSLSLSLSPLLLLRCKGQSFSLFAPPFRLSLLRVKLLVMTSSLSPFISSSFSFLFSCSSKVKEADPHGAGRTSFSFFSFGGKRR